MKINKHQVTTIKSAILDGIEFKCVDDDYDITEIHDETMIYFQCDQGESLIPIFQAIENQNVFVFNSLHKASSEENEPAVVVICVEFGKIKNEINSN